MSMTSASRSTPSLSEVRSVDSRSGNSDGYLLSKELDAACVKNDCPLAAVLKDIAPFLASPVATTFFTSRPLVLSTLPTSAIRCERVAETFGGFRGCTTSVAVDAGELLAPLTDLWCDGPASSPPFSCVGVGVPKKQ